MKRKLFRRKVYENSVNHLLALLQKIAILEFASTVELVRAVTTKCAPVPMDFKVPDVSMVSSKSIQISNFLSFAKKLSLHENYV